jgi:hypothetical protein
MEFPDTFGEADGLDKKLINDQLGGGHISGKAARKPS